MTDPLKKRFLRVNDIVAEFGISRSTIFRWRDQGKLPPAKKLTPRVVGWPREQIEQVFLK